MERENKPNLDWTLHELLPEDGDIGLRTVASHRRRVPDWVRRTLFYVPMFPIVLFFVYLAIFAYLVGDYDFAIYAFVLTALWFVLVTLFEKYCVDN